MEKCRTGAGLIRRHVAMLSVDVGAVAHKLDDKLNKAQPAKHDPPLSVTI